MLFQKIQRNVVGILIEDAIKLRTVFSSQDTLIVHWCKDRQTILLADLVVIITIARRGMNQPRPCFKRDVITINDQHFLVVIWVLAGHAIHVLTRQPINDFIFIPAELFSTFGNQLIGNYKLTIIISRLNYGIDNLRVHGNGFRSWNRPRSSRPANQVRIIVQTSLAINNLFTEVGRLGYNVMIFNFGFCQCRFR